MKDMTRNSFFIYAHHGEVCVEQLGAHGDKPLLRAPLAQFQGIADVDAPWRSRTCGLCCAVRILSAVFDVRTGEPASVALASLWAEDFWKSFLQLSDARAPDIAATAVHQWIIAMLKVELEHGVAECFQRKATPSDN